MYRRALFILVLVWQIAAVVAADERTLAILLTNDDGYDSAGLSTLRDALLADGHRVTVVAPLSQQSGSGVKVTLGTYKKNKAHVSINQL